MELPWTLTPDLWALYGVALGLQLLLGGAVLLRPGPLDLRRWAAVLAVLAGLEVGLAVAARFVRGPLPFTWMGLLWIAFALVLPLLGAVALVSARRGRPSTGPGRLLAALACALLLPAAWASLVEPYRLELVTVDVPPVRGTPADTPLRVGVLADLQTAAIGDHERRAVRTLMEAHPDLVLIPGDLFQLSTRGWPRLRDDLRALLRELDAPLGVLAVDGDSDHPVRLRELVEGTPLRLLEDEEVRLEHGGRTIRVLGLRHGAPGDRARAAVRALGASEAAGELRLVLVHRPGRVLGEEFEGAAGIDLVVAGHTHGGQVQVPFLGPPLDLSPLPARITGGGLHPVGATRVYISRGVGMERNSAPRLRFWCRPEVSLLELR